MVIAVRIHCKILLGMTANLRKAAIDYKPSGMSPVGTESSFKNKNSTTASGTFQPFGFKQN
jgi:hypothetical protein